MPQSRFYFTIKCAGFHRAFLSSVENTRSDKGDVYLILSSGINFMAPNRDDLSGPQIISQRYSLHASKISNDYTTIKQTLILRDSPTIYTYQITDAIKRKSGFAPLFSCYCQNLDRGRYLVAENRIPLCINIGHYNPLHFTFVYSLFVGPTDLMFGEGNQTTNVLQHVFGECSIVLLWSFLTLPSHSTGRYLHHVTINPVEAGSDSTTKKALEDIMIGRPRQSCLDNFEAHKLLLLHAYINTVSRAEGLSEEQVKEMRTIADYLKEPSMFSAEYKAYRNRASRAIRALDEAKKTR
jgi:hypothetical protein